MLICKHQIQEIGNIWSKKLMVLSKSVEGIQILIVHVKLRSFCKHHQLLLVHLSKENQVAIWMNGDHIADITIKVTHSSKQLQEAHPVLEDPSFCISAKPGQTSPF